MRPILSGFAVLACLAAPLPLRATESEGDSPAARMVEHARHHFGVARSVTGCSRARSSDEIVVCGLRKPDPRYEPPAPPRQPDAKAVALGAPPVGKGVGVGATITGCFLQKCPKKLYFIDLAAIPEAPPGSDADRIARGEMRAH